MHILIAGQTYVPALNGQAVFTTNLAEGLQQRGHVVTVVTPSLDSTPYRSRRNSVTIEAMRAIPLTLLHKWAYVTPFPSRHVEKLFDRYHPDVVHVQDHYPLCRAVVDAARRRRIPCVGTNHFLPQNLLPYLPLPDTLTTLAERFLWWPMIRVFNQLDHVVAPSKTAAEIVRGNGVTVPVSAISCGVNLNRFHPNGNSNYAEQRRGFGLDPSAALLLFVGRVDEEKQLDLLLRALHRLDRPDVQLAIVGRGEVLPDLNRLKQNLGLNGQVTFTGPVDTEDLITLLNAADIFTMPSESELLSIATLEAMACGRPVLAARARALPELVHDGVNGYLFEPGNVDDAAGKIARLVDNRDNWPAMSAASVQRARQHSLERILDCYEAIYQRLGAVPSS